MKKSTRSKRIKPANIQTEPVERVQSTAEWCTPKPLKIATGYWFKETPDGSNPNPVADADGAMNLSQAEQKFGWSMRKLMNLHDMFFAKPNRDVQEPKPAAATTYWFELVNGSPVPVRYEEADEERNCGFEVVNLAEAVARFGLSESLLKKLWHNRCDPPTEWMETTSNDRGEYYPEIAEDWLLDIQEGRYFIRTGENVEPLIEIVINQTIEQKSRERIARLLADAPALWQMLRDQVNTMVGYEDYEGLCSLLECLRHSCGRRPVDFTAAPTDEKAVLAHHNRATVAKLVS